MLSKVNTIKERKEEYLNEIKEIKIKKPKTIKYEINDINKVINKLNSGKRITKIIISSSFLNENNKKTPKEKEKIKTENNESIINYKINKTKKLKLKSKKTMRLFQK